MAWTEKLPSGHYRAVYRLPDGSKRRLDGTYTHKRAAERAANAAEAETREPGWRDPAASLRPWNTWADEWFEHRRVDPSTLERDRSRLKTLRTKWGDTPIRDITRTAVKQWAQELLDEGRAHATVQRHLSLLSASLTDAADSEIIPANPMLRLKLGLTPNVNERTLSPEEQHRLFAAFRPPGKLTPEQLATVERDQAIIAILLGSGSRWSEGIALAAHHFTREGIRYRRAWDTRNRELKEYTKGKTRRTVPLAPWLDELTQPIREARPRGFLFDSGNGNPIDYSNWKRDSWNPAIERSGLNQGEHDDNVTPHTLRHTYATEQLEAGLTIAEIADLLGHASLAMAERYAHRRKTVRPEAATAIRDPRSAVPIEPALPPNVIPLFGAR